MWLLVAAFGGGCGGGGGGAGGGGGRGPFFAIGGGVFNPAAAAVALNGGSAGQGGANGFGFGLGGFSGVGHGRSRGRGRKHGRWGGWPEDEGHDPALDDLRELYRPLLRERFAAWWEAALALDRKDEKGKGKAKAKEEQGEGKKAESDEMTTGDGDAILASAYDLILAQMPWAKGEDVVKEMAAALRDRPSKAHLISSLGTLTKFCKERQKLMAQREQERSQRAQRARQQALSKSQPQPQSQSQSQPQSQSQLSEDALLAEMFPPRLGGIGGFASGLPLFDDEDLRIGNEDELGLDEDELPPLPPLSAPPPPPGGSTFGTRASMVRVEPSPETLAAAGVHGQDLTWYGPPPSAGLGRGGGMSPSAAGGAGTSGSTGSGSGSGSNSGAEAGMDTSVYGVSIDEVD